MHVVVAIHKATGRTYRTQPMVVAGTNYAPDESKCVMMAIDQLRRDKVVSIDQPDDYQFEIVSV
jgi:hypothetical protein